MRRALVLSSFALLLFLLPAAGSAQSVGDVPSAAGVALATVEARAEPASVLIRAPERFAPAELPDPLGEARADVAPMQPAQNLGRDGALMVVGAALFVAGLIIGDDAGTALAVAGAAIGGYGLYLYIQ